MIRVLLIDDHAIFREGLKLLMGESEDVRAEGEATGGREGLTLAQSGEWDVVLMDLTMPEGSGLDTLSQFRAVLPELPVLILSMHPEDQFAIRALKAGAAGYLCKDAAPDELLDAIRHVAAGRKYVSPSIAQHIVSSFGSEEKATLHENLSDREFQVLRLLGAGKTVGQIAEDLALSAKTVSTYRARLLEKMNMNSNAELIRYALENQLVE